MAKAQTTSENPQGEVSQQAADGVQALPGVPGVHRHQDPLQGAVRAGPGHAG